MEHTEANSLKEKLARSRSLWLGFAVEKFLERLYRVLDDPKNNEIICWSENGRLILIKDEKKIASQITRYFECCSTLLNFCQRLEDCLFAEVFNKKHPRGNAYEHLFLTRDTRPDFQFLRIPAGKRIKGQNDTSNKNKHSFSDPPLKKIVKREADSKITDSKPSHSEIEQGSEHSYAPIPSFSTMISDFYAEIRSQDLKKKHMKSMILSMALFEKFCQQE